MTDIELLKIVQQVTGYSLTHLRHRHRDEAVMDARYVLILLLIEEGYTAKYIADLLMLCLSTFRYSRRTADGLLESDKKFKTLYLNCITQITQLEDAY